MTTLDSGSKSNKKLRWILTSFSVDFVLMSIVLRVSLHSVSYQVFVSWLVVFDVS